MQNKKIWPGVALALVLGAAQGVWFYMQPSKPIRSTVKPRPVQVLAPKEQAQPKPTASDAKGGGRRADHAPVRVMVLFGKP